MKKENRIRSIINKSSFQTQLFSIVLLSLVSFILFSYVIILYSFKSTYLNSEVDNLESSINEAIIEINVDSDNTASYLYDLYSSYGCMPLILDTSGGGYTLKVNDNIEYTVEIVIKNETYKINIVDYSLKINLNDSVKGYIKKSESNSYYVFKKVYINDKLVVDEPYDDECIYIDSTVDKINELDNINFLFSSNEFSTSNIDVLIKNVSRFKKTKIDGTSYSSYYLDVDNGYAYFLVKPYSFDESDDLLFIVSSFVKTDSLLSIVQSYYGYIVLVSVVISVLIAVFISYAFSNPIRIIEKEIKKLRNSNYKTSSYEFKNREMISLQDSINEVKIDTEKKVLDIEDQKNSLETLNKELLRENDLRSSFIARLSHELKTPLMVISATTEALMSGLIKDEDKDKEYNNILDEIDKTTGIIKDIISTYKTKTKETKLNKERFCINNLIKEILDPLMSLAQKKNLDVETNLDSLEYMNADYKLIGDVISNFITNAFKYTEDNNKVEINVKNNKESFRFEVKNYGSKIDPMNLDKIWLPFFRENENVEKTSTGMGLYIVKEILDAHGYKYGVENFDNGVISYFEVNK